MQYRWTTLVAASVILAACGDGTGPGATGDIDVHMTITGGAAGTVASVLGAEGGSLGGITLDAVDSINITLTGIDALRSTGEDSARIRLALVEDGTARINLLSLPQAPTDDADPDDDAVAIRIARGEVPAGTYNGIRLRYEVQTATVTLNRAVTVGQESFAAGTHVLQIPSGAQTGIKVPFQSLVIGDGTEADVVLTFEPGTTVRNVVATGSGKLLMPPVLKARAARDD